MPYRLKLVLDRVTCLDDTIEITKDEMYVFALGVAQTGERISHHPFSLGSFKTGRQKQYTTNHLFQLDMQDKAKLNFAAYLWLVEEDGDYVRNRFDEIRSEFNATFDREVARLRGLGVSEDVLAIAALEGIEYELRYRIGLLANNGSLGPISDADELLFPVLVRYNYPYPNPLVASTHQWQPDSQAVLPGTINASGEGASYRVNYHWVFESSETSEEPILR